ncbi:MAG: hypothetical protein JNL32_13480, partial [Candidatus Kapabacteria bacterium]|nr:hypothetical protein [Candidatus Kapabacteria bacterium]
EFNGIAEMDITARLSSDSIPAGGLEINQTSYDATNMVQIVDYIRIKGVQNAIASSNRFDAVDTLAQQVNVRVHGFTHPDILTLDSMSRTASRSIGKRGYTVRCGASSSSMIWNTITIGDSIVFASDTIGVTVVIISPNGSITTLSQRDVSDNLINTIRTSVDGSLIVLSSNSANDIGTNLKALLISSGLTVIGNVLPGHCYAAAYIKGTSRIFESTSPTVASLSEFIESENANSYQALIPLSQGAVHPVIGAGTGIEQAQVRPVNTVDLRSPDLYAKNIIITHKSFASQAQRLADFHTSKGDTSIVVDVDDIYIQFGSYQKTPHAIKYFLRYAYTSWMKPAPEYVTIFGDASWDPRMIPPHGRMVDYVPSYGKPVSDFWYTLLDGNDQIPEMNVGRITVDTPEEARNYVDKIFEMDTIPPQQFDKRFLLMSAGIGKNEEQTFYETNVEGVSKFIDWQDGQTLCGDTVIYARYRTMPTGFSESSFIKSTINSGVSWVNFIGHAAPTVFEISGWDEKQLANAGRYPILSTFSCQSGAFAERDVLTLNEAYIRPPRRGMIGAIGTTGYGITTTDREIQLLIFEQLSIRGIRNVGEVLSRAKSTFIERYGSIMSVADRNVIDQTLLLGDPLYRIRIDTLPHPYTQERDVFIRNSTGNTFITEDDDSAHVQIVIRNAGMFARQPIPVRIIHSYNGVADTTNLSLIDFCKFDVLSFSFVAKEQPGDHKIIIHIDPDNRLRFSNTVRRVYEYTSYIYAPLPLALDPFPGWTVDATAPRFRFINPLSSTSSFDYECRLVRNRDSLLLSEVKAKDQRTLRIDSTFVEWKPSVSLTANTEHHFSVRLIDNIKNKISPWLTIPVKPVESLQTGIVRITHNTSEDWKLYSYTGLVPDSLRPHTLAMRYYIPFRIYGATGAGYQDNNGQYVPLIERAYTLNIQGRTYSDERNDKAGRWHVRTLPRHDTIVRVATDFFTREHKPRTEISNDSMYKEFMRDSILDDEYVFVVTNERWWSWMDGDTTYKSRYFNDIKPAFRSLGAKLIDTLEPPQAYAFVGMRSAFPYRNFEAVRFDTGYKRADTTEIRGSVKISPRFGELRSPIFGPASSWKSVTIHGRFPDTSCTVTIVVEGRSNPTSNPVELAVVKSPVIRLDSLNAKLYRYISFRLLIDRKSYASDAEIDSVTVEFEPPVELAAQPSSLRVSPTSVLRGDTTIQSAVMKLISPRTNTLPQLQSTMTYTPVRGNWQPISRVFNVENVNPDVELMITDTMPTLNQSTETQVAFTLNQNASVDDFYSFNNRISTTAYVQDDTVKPVIRLFIDSNEVKDDEVVAMSSSFRVMVYDNANLPVDDTSLVRAIVNLPVNKQRDPDLRYYNTKDAKAIFGSEVQLRQGMSFSRMLEIGTNNITVTANDIFGNTAVLKRVVRVSDRIDIESPVVQPNPIETHSAAIKYVYRGQQRNAPVTV